MPLDNKLKLILAAAALIVIIALLLLTQPAPPACGDGVCRDGETAETCPADCAGITCRDETYGCYIGELPCCEGLVQIEKTRQIEEGCATSDCGLVCAPCGNGVCDSFRENCCSCPEDCGQCLPIEEYRTPIMTCTLCDPPTDPERECCTDAFESDCESQGGAVCFVDGHPGPFSWKECYKKAPDAGEACASAEDCLATPCDLQIAIDEGRCTLIEKTVTGANEYDGSEFYTATYTCTTDKPGECLEVLPDRINPGGTSHTFKMKGTQLTEVRGPGMIR